MEEIIKVVVDNGVAVACFIAFIYFIFADKKESNELFTKTNEVLKQINSRMKVLDIGTGSGAIAITIAYSTKINILSGSLIIVKINAFLYIAHSGKSYVISIG